MAWMKPISMPAARKHQNIKIKSNYITNAPRCPRLGHIRTGICIYFANLCSRGWNCLEKKSPNSRTRPKLILFLFWIFCSSFLALPSRAWIKCLGPKKQAGDSWKCTPRCPFPEDVGCPGRFRFFMAWIMHFLPFLAFYWPPFFEANAFSWAWICFY